MKLPPRSNRVECLFSQAKVMLTPLRVSLLPVNIAMLMFLRTNSSYWDLATVSAIYQQAQCFAITFPRCKSIQYDAVFSEHCFNP
ncbi:hypothetical protein PF002_g9903 [Phytophthora fragariae]|uniref:HAT C-terminal dimerisation domain-containing protein n=1 Tax=Phytophthora fragariae TaxID=53985 RepID=A0A6A3ZND8_9STRA|nr:hypothetical protein PF003_g8256 [Phytophthora fragariae]KAE8939904.1 hypothetical protein PF009_g10270 [Phytophthora fragariae]KAE9151722.1 hypothetical protein PF006_g4006 [Phytophthora fragariae]KAE9240163.1 hypothetical protein PF002_g9903 [Phytophthora fragariae]KAE9326813.1 hypothetical protein PF001_g2238 [Phytophthora fragariae]